MRDGRPGNGGKLGLFLDLFEITPQINRQGSFVVDAEDRQSAQVLVRCLGGETMMMWEENVGGLWERKPGE